MKCNTLDSVLHCVQQSVTKLLQSNVRGKRRTPRALYANCSLWFADYKPSPKKKKKKKNTLRAQLSSV